MENDNKEKEEFESAHFVTALVIAVILIGVVLIVAFLITGSFTGIAGNNVVCNKLAAQINSGNTTAIAIWTANECPCYNNNLIPQTLKSVDFSNTTMCESLNSFSAR